MLEMQQELRGEPAPVSALREVLMRTIYDLDPDQWENLQLQARLLKDLVDGKESPRKLSSIERTRLRIIIGTIAAFQGER
jgi:hypothetical protein